ncbi:nucleoside 2-deoxyribosyltransferase domain-containing protein [Flavobacterium sp.]|uniref:nucleoside 2-deoxyribosyltransferase domain-containing protein n=1 Tax=Flavobacterium sp. TaxID=239 RepID=UPI0037538802
MENIYKSPENIDNRDKTRKSIFLAGSIEMDKAVNWQKKCEEKLAEKYIVFNPRRESWNNNWEQSINNPQFKEQVSWELEALEKADIIIMFFAANTKSPISLLELGLFSNSGKLKVIVENEFWRKGNVDIVCERYNLEQYDNLDVLLELLMK